MDFNSDKKNWYLIKKVLLQSKFQSYQIVVNSDLDGEINPDQDLTLREAISLVNNTIDLSELSASEAKQVMLIEDSKTSRIEFGMSSPMTIELKDILPPLISPGLVIDGTTHFKYDPKLTTTAEIPIPIPTISLTPEKGKDIFRGLTISGDRIKVKGLSIYGFSQTNNPIDTTPSADIVVSSRLTHLTDELSKLSLSNTDNSPQDVEIVDNWLGLPPDETLTHIPSSFGIWLFDGINTNIRRNRISHHGGSGILTSVAARETKISENIIVGNGLTGMPHAIYLEGAIHNSAITDNLVCGNDGSAVYLFKPEGNIKINSNTIKYNGRRVPSAAIYLIGNDHQLTNNQISWQTGTGVTIAAYPQSDRNLIENNSFNDLEGLSIDLNTRHQEGKPFWKLGDGVNPPRNSRNRKRDTANRSINSPQFLSEEFYLIDERVHIDGIADPDSKVTLYQVELGIPRSIEEQSPLANRSANYGPLSKPLTEVVADAKGRFSFSMTNLEPGTIISAIALEESASKTKRTLTFPVCTTKPSKSPTKVELPPRRRAVHLDVPRNIHFALDKSAISLMSAEVLNTIALVLKEHPFITVELQGHTDFRASNQYNMALSRRRAISTRNYLVQQGIDPARMTILPLGESQLEKTGNTIVEHAYNRRVEIIFRDFHDQNILLRRQTKDLQVEQ